MTSQQEPPGSRPTLFTRMFGAARFVMTIASLAVFAGATVLLTVGVIQMVNAVWLALFGPHSAEDGSVALRVSVIEAVDVILVATVMFLIAFGLYQLFVDPALRSSLPGWLHITSIGHLEIRLAGMVVTVLSVIAMSRALESHGNTTGSGVGFEIAAVIAAVSLFLFQEAKHPPPGEGSDEQ